MWCPATAAQASKGSLLTRPFLSKPSHSDKVDSMPYSVALQTPARCNPPCAQGPPCWLSMLWFGLHETWYCWHHPRRIIQMMLKLYMSDLWFISWLFFQGKLRHMYSALATAMFPWCLSQVAHPESDPLLFKHGFLARILAFERNSAAFLCFQGLPS